MWKSAEEFLIKDKYIAPLVKKYGHCTIKSRNKKYYFEDLVDAITQQQLSMKAASSIFNRLKEVLATQNETASKNSVEHKWRESRTLNVEITPETILRLKEDDLRGCGLSRAKVFYLRDLSEKALNGELQVKNLDKLPDEEIIKKLVTVKGIGEWTAHMFLMFTLGRPDIFPSGDLGLRNAFEKIVKKGQDRKQMEKFAERWKPYKTVASWYLWRSLEN
jgi:DNA-3-methyladenine glycosylase II